MVVVDDIDDSDGLKSWLDQTVEHRGEDKGRHAAVFIAHRAALRSLPLYWKWALTSERAKKDEIAAIATLRSSLIASVAGSSLTSEIIEAAEHASIASDGTYGEMEATLTFASVDCLVAAVSAGDIAVTIEKALASITYASNALQNFVAVDPLIQTRLDARSVIAGNSHPGPLWPGDNPLAVVWEETRSATMSVTEGPTHWSFWRRWYDDALKGGPPRNPELLKAVALIDPEDWDKGPGFINDVKIPELQAEHARRIASTAAEIVRDKATGVFIEVAVSDLEDGLFRDARERANEAIADFRKFIDRPHRRPPDTLLRKPRRRDACDPRYRQVQRA